MCFDASHSHEIIAYPVLLTSSRWSSGAPTDNGSSHSGRLVVRRGDILELGEVTVGEVNVPGRVDLLELGEAACGTLVMDVETEVGPCCAT